MEMNDLKASLFMGALAQEAMTPQTVKDLHVFFKQNPQYVAEVEKVLGYGSTTIDGLAPIMGLKEGLNLEAANAGLDQRTQSDLFGFGDALQGEPPSPLAEGGPELV